MKKKGKFYSKSLDFIDNALVNDQTYFDYLDRFKKVAVSIFEWENLPSSMNARYLEQCLYYDGKAALLFDDTRGFINTRCTTNGYINIYGLPNRLKCFSYDYRVDRNLFTGKVELDTEDAREFNERLKDNTCILVLNNWDAVPTAATLELFALRLYEAEQTAMVNIKAQKTPVMVLVDENQRLMMENLYSQYDGNKPVIFGDKNQLNGNVIKSINTEAPFIADKVMDYKKEIWNEALTFLGINNVMVDKKERLVADEANSNNELINLNLQAALIPRQEAAKQFNELFGLTGTDKEIKVRVRSDLHNIIKNNESIINDYNNNGIDDSEEVVDYE